MYILYLKRFEKVEESMNGKSKTGIRLKVGIVAFIIVNLIMVAIPGQLGATSTVSGNVEICEIEFSWVWTSIMEVLDLSLNLMCLYAFYVPLKKHLVQMNKTNMTKQYLDLKAVVYRNWRGCSIGLIVTFISLSTLGLAKFAAPNNISFTVLASPMTMLDELINLFCMLYITRNAWEITETHQDSCFSRIIGKDSPSSHHTSSPSKTDLESSKTDHPTV